MTTEQSPLSDLARAAYLVAYPLVADLDQVDRYVSTGVGSTPAAAFNIFGHARTLATPDDTFVTINNDTVYSLAQIDLSVGPVRLAVPDTDDRYYVLQFVDAWTDNFAYVGKRGTGTAASAFLLVPPDWDGESDETVIRFPTRIASIVGRWACSGDDDLPAVHALQDATTLTALAPSAVPRGLPAPATSGDEALDFFEKFRLWSQAFPPAERDRAQLASFEPLGLTGGTPVGELPDELRAALTAGYEQGRQTLSDALHHPESSPEVNGWKLTLHVFDYNLDFFEVGTVDDEQWKIADPRIRLIDRASAAAAGLWGNHGYEAAYVMTYVDQQGEQLDGTNSYRLRLSPTPPVGAFWSLTMYDVPNFFLVANPIGRYSIGDRTPGIRYDDDGGLTITMSAAEPTDPVARANWLPAPAGPFRPVLRMYIPGPGIFDGNYTLSAIERG